LLMRTPSKVKLPEIRAVMIPSVTQHHPFVFVSSFFVSFRHGGYAILTREVRI
jgi:hypothetical protein